MQHMASRNAKLRAAPPSARKICPQSRKLHHGNRWGDWRLNGERLTLDYKPSGIWRYEVDLERIHDSASLVDWIFQVHGHSFHLQWPSDVMQDLLDALNAIFRPQANLCSAGRDKRLPAGFLREHIEPPPEPERKESSRQTRQTYEAWGIQISNGEVSR
jgi:hypothetical protein